MSDELIPGGAPDQAGPGQAPGQDRLAPGSVFVAYDPLLSLYTYSALSYRVGENRYPIIPLPSLPDGVGISGITVTVQQDWGLSVDAGPVTILDLTAYSPFDTRTGQDNAFGLGSYTMRYVFELDNGDVLFGVRRVDVVAV